MALGVGATLREARERRGLDLRQVNRITKIRVRYLSAIEKERWEELPGPAYVRGFVSTYAELLELDPAELLERLDEEVPLVPADVLAVADGDAALGHGEPPPPPIRPGRRRRRPVPYALALAALALVAGVVLAINALGGGDDARSDAERAAQQKPAGGGDERGAEGEAAPPEADGEGEAEAEEARAEPERIEVAIRPEADVWACLLDAGGEPLVAGEILPAGERVGPFRSRHFVLALGHGSVEVEVDGEPVDVPDTPDPVGFKLRPGGAKPLAADEMPDCL